jgi:hypothetical protein
MRFSISVQLSFILLSAQLVSGQDNKPEWSAGPIDFSGLIDGYYSLNFNHPATRNNVIRNFDVRANQFELNMLKLSAEHAADPVGFRVDLGFGRTFELFHATEPLSTPVFRNIMQAYMSFRPQNLGGLQVDFGKFVTSAGAEPTETHLNWNYSRSLLFTNGPYYHFGLRTSVPVNKYVSAGVQIVNGWNNVEDNNSGKTIGLTSSISTSKFSWSNNYYVGPEKTDTNEGRRHFFDTVLFLTPHDRANFYLNFDYGADTRIGGGRDTFYGIAGAARFALTEHISISPRLELYNDVDGFITGTPQKLKEFTLTAEYKWSAGLLSRLEYRRDWSDRPFFDRGNEPGSALSQNTLLAGFVVYFGPGR